jgi:hypothetical protein
MQACLAFSLKPLAFGHLHSQLPIFQNVKEQTRERLNAVIITWITGTANARL